MEKYIESVSELNLGKRIGGGSCSEVFEMDEGIYFKKFNEDYIDLTDPINQEFFEVIKTISGIDYLPFIIRGKDVYRSKNELFGYSMDSVSALELEDISDDTLVSDLMIGFEGLKVGIRGLSDNFVKTEDIGGDNIIFNDSGMYLLDLDLSLVDKRYIPDELYERCMNSLLCAVRQKVIGDSRFDDMVKNDEYFSYLMRLKNDCSEALGKEVVTISDMHNGYSKIKNRI